MENNYDKYQEAKRILGFNLCLSKSRRKDGTIDETKLDELLKQNYEYIKRQFMKKIEIYTNVDAQKVEEDIQNLEYLYSLIKDNLSRKNNDLIAKKNEHINNLPNISEGRENGIIRGIKSIPIKKESYKFQIFSKEESAEIILVIPLKKYQYITNLGVIAYLSEYEIVKNINGKNSHFTVTTNTDFDEVNRIKNLNRELTDVEEEYIRMFYNQMSDIHLNVCKERFNGYIGTVENNLFSARFDMDSEDYAATNEIRKQELEEER